MSTLSRWAGFISIKTIIQQFSSSDIGKFKTCLLDVLQIASERDFCTQFVQLIHDQPSVNDNDNNPVTDVLTKLKPEATIVENNIEKDKQIIFEQFNIQSQCQFISKFLQLMESKLDKAVIELLYNEANSISIESQYPVVKPKNKLCSLSSNMIQYIAMYLTKTESISFGYINRQLYIETQNISYVINRRSNNDCNKNEEILILDPSKLQKLSKMENPSGFGYCFPLWLEFTGNKCGMSFISNLVKTKTQQRKRNSNYKYNKNGNKRKTNNILKSKASTIDGFKKDLVTNDKVRAFFDRFFCYLNGLTVRSHAHGILACIPIKKLFGLQNGSNSSHYNELHCLEYLDIDMLSTNVSSLLAFCKNYQQLCVNQAQSNANKDTNSKSTALCGNTKNTYDRYRELDTLKVNLGLGFGSHADPQSLAIIVKCLTPNFHRFLLKSGSIRLKSIDVVGSIFHEKIQFIKFYQAADVNIQCLCKNNANNASNANNAKNNAKKDVSNNSGVVCKSNSAKLLNNFKELELFHSERGYCVSLWKDLCSSGLAKTVESLTIAGVTDSKSINRWIGFESKPETDENTTANADAAASANADDTGGTQLSAVPNQAKNGIGKDKDGCLKQWLVGSIADGKCNVNINVGAPKLSTVRFKSFAICAYNDKTENVETFYHAGFILHCLTKYKDYIKHRMKNKKFIIEYRIPNRVIQHYFVWEDKTYYPSLFDIHNQKDCQLLEKFKCHDCNVRHVTVNTDLTTKSMANIYHSMVTWLRKLIIHHQRNFQKNGSDFNACVTIVCQHN